MPPWGILPQGRSPRRLSHLFPQPIPVPPHLKVDNDTLKSYHVLDINGLVITNRPKFKHL
jgi:hypothetical protein